MNSLSLSLNPIYWITKYYDELTNQIDIFVESEISKQYTKIANDNDAKKFKKDNSEKNYFDCIREEFLEEINQVKNSNFHEFRLNESTIKNKIDQMKNVDEELTGLIENLKSEYLFKKFCFIIKTIDPNLIYLVTTDVYLNSEEILYLNSSYDEAVKTIDKFSIIKSIIHMNLPEMVCKKVTVTFKEINEIILELSRIKNFQSLGEKSIYTISDSFKRLSLQDLLNNVTKITFDSINSNCYFNLSNLKELIINQTNMVEVKGEMFESLTNLKMLDLSNNLISFIESNSFNNLLGLEKLNLNSNSIIIIQTNLFKNLKGLKELYLDLDEEDDDGNEMIIEYNAFDCLENLEILKISKYRLPVSDDINHKISSLLSQASKFLICLDQKPKTSLFKNLTSLKQLKISIQNELDNNEFDTLTNLEELSLRFKSAKSIKFHMFDLMKNLKVLKIQIIENLEKIDEKIFNQLFKLEEISLDIPVKLPFSIFLLSHLKMLKKIVFKGLDLSESNIGLFKDDKKIFERTDKLFDLKVLRLIENYTLERFQGNDLFENLEGLIELNLEANPTLNDILRKNYFNSLKSLKILRLDLCNLKDDSFDKYLFEGVKNLEELYMNENLIENINLGWFVGLEKLKILSIEMNQIRTINQFSFENLEKVEEISLSNNSIQIIHPNLFISQKNLKNLLLNENELTYLDDFSLNGLNNLVELDLRANKLVQIRSNALKCLQNLNILLINRQRSLFDFDFGCLKPLKKLKHIFVDNKIDLKEYVYFEGLEINLHKKFLNTTFFKKIINDKFLIEKDFDFP